MASRVEIRGGYLLKDALRYADKVITKEGNIYYKFPYWFQFIPDGSLVMHPTVPEDLAEFITKAGFGGNHPQPVKPIV